MYIVYRLWRVQVTVRLTDENDCSPVFSAGYSSHKTLARSSVPGTVVAKFSASDPDLDDVILYSVTCSLPTNQNLPFTVNSTTGELDNFS